MSKGAKINPNWIIRPAYPLTFGDMLEVGKHLGDIPELRDVWLRAFQDRACLTVVRHETSLPRHANEGAWGNDLTGVEAESLLDTADEGSSEWCNMWLVLMAYGQRSTVLHLLREKQDVVELRGFGILRNYTITALETNLQLPAVETFEQATAERMTLTQWVELLETAPHLRRKFGPIPLPTGWRGRVAQFSAQNGNCTQLVRKAKEVLGRDPGAWRLFFELMDPEQYEPYEAVEVAAATLSGEPEPFPQRKKRGWLARLLG